MKRITIFRHPTCAKCARIARVHRAFDFLDRIAVSTATPPSGALRPGEVVVLEHRTGRYLAGAEAFAAICRANPLYAPFRAALWIPALRRAVDRELRGGAAASRVANGNRPTLA